MKIFSLNGKGSELYGRYTDLKKRYDDGGEMTPDEVGEMIELGGVLVGAFSQVLDNVLSDVSEVLIMHKRGDADGLVAVLNRMSRQGKPTDNGAGSPPQVH